MDMKLCHRCKQLKPYSDFHKFRRSSDGYKPICKSCRIEESQRYYIQNREKIRVKSKRFRDDHPDNQKEYYRNHSGYFSKYREDHREHYKKWRDDHRSEICEYQKRKKQSDPSFRILCNLRSRISTLIKQSRGHKSVKTKELIGCSISEFRKHLESQFRPGMSWSNYGEWHIDHIKPCSSFDLSNTDQQKKCFHFTNQQPLWALDNIRKSDKI